MNVRLNADAPPPSKRCAPFGVTNRNALLRERNASAPPGRTYNDRPQNQNETRPTPNRSGLAKAATASHGPSSHTVSTWRRWTAWSVCCARSTTDTFTTTATRINFAPRYASSTDAPERKRSSPLPACGSDRCRERAKRCVRASTRRSMAGPAKNAKRWLLRSCRSSPRRSSSTRKQPKSRVVKRSPRCRPPSSRSSAIRSSPAKATR